MKKTIRIILTVLVIILALFLFIIGGFNIYLRIAFSDFYSAAKTHGNVPGISDGFIQQGISYVPESEKFISCGYMKDATSSRIYIFDEKDESYVCLNDISGAPSTSHAGGLSYWKGYVFLTDENNILVYSWNDIEASSEKSGNVDPIASFDVGFSAAFCYVSEDDLYVGEFYREQNYPTDKTHHMTTPAGDVHHALMAKYDLSEISDGDFSVLKPNALYSIPDLAQGMCVTPSGRICISTSYALATSHIYVYDTVSSKQNETTGMSIDFLSEDVPIYYLDSSNTDEDIKFFPMSEELVLKEGRIYIMNESASAKYIFGKLTGGSKLYSIAID